MARQPSALVTDFFMITPHLPLLFSPPPPMARFLTTPDLRRHAHSGSYGHQSNGCPMAHPSFRRTEYHRHPGHHLPSERASASIPRTAPSLTTKNFLQTGLPVALLPFYAAHCEELSYAYAQQGNLTIERQLGHELQIQHRRIPTLTPCILNRPRNIDSTDPKLLAQNLRNALAAGIAGNNPYGVVAPLGNTAASSSTCGVNVIAPRALGGSRQLSCGCRSRISRWAVCRHRCILQLLQAVSAPTPRSRPRRRISQRGISCWKWLAIPLAFREYKSPGPAWTSKSHLGTPFLSRTHSKFLQAFHEPLRIPVELHLVPCDRRFH